MSDAKDKLSVFDDNDEITTLRAENERLREWNREIALNARELVAENERLRAALKPFVCDCEGEAICIGECMHRNARAALDGQPAPGKEEA